MGEKIDHKLGDKMREVEKMGKEIGRKVAKARGDGHF